MINESEILLIVAILRVNRRSRKNGDVAGADKTERDVRDVLQAMDTAGYQILPRGVIDAIKKMLKQLL